MWFAPKLPDLGSPEDADSCRYDEAWQTVLLDFCLPPEPGVIEVPASRVGRCRRHAPTMNGYPVVFVQDWCGDHKLNENWQQANEAQP